jgi:hypothetical protein
MSDMDGAFSVDGPPVEEELAHVPSHGQQDADEYTIAGEIMGSDDGTRLSDDDVASAQRTWE